MILWAHRLAALAILAIACFAAVPAAAHGGVAHRHGVTSTVTAIAGQDRQLAACVAEAGDSASVLRRAPVQRRDASGNCVEGCCGTGMPCCASALPSAALTQPAHLDRATTLLPVSDKVERPIPSSPRRPPRSRA